MNTEQTNQPPTEAVETSAACDRHYAEYVERLQPIMDDRSGERHR